MTAPSEGWKIVIKLLHIIPIKNNKMEIKDYHGIITDIKKHESGDDKKTLFTVKYDDGTTCDRIQVRYLFIPGMYTQNFVML